MIPEGCEHLMDKEAVREYIKNNLTLTIGYAPKIKQGEKYTEIAVYLVLEGQKISKSSITIKR